ncbi:uncharacterized protein LOC120626541 [Pararge aegeria]|uniref:uncharacterized protein LOC120626541 n=1 Tax=Pararge aegeria TaxID=116150 RepID=UPI0019D01751|nr:uncharacterized protein LOC120626541 [Pararge aegeria]
MFLCGKCNNDTEEAIQCCVCKKFFDYPCSGITEIGYRKLGDRQATWKCATCKHVQGAKKQPGSPVPSPTSLSMDTVMAELTKLSLQLQPLPELFKDIHCIKSDMAALSTSTQELISRIDRLEKRIDNIESVSDAMPELRVAISQLQEQIDEQDQWLRYNNIEIKGVPVKHNENLFDVLSKIGTKITFPVSKNNINFIARVQSRNPSENKIKPIIVSFINRYLKEDFVAAGKALKTLITSDIGIPGNTRIFINDHLTVKNKQLLSKTKLLAKEKNYRFVWVKHSKLFVRKNETSPVLSIKAEKDLTKVK